MFKISDKLSIIRYTGDHYNYTIDALEFGTLNLLHITAMMCIEIIEGIAIIESMNGYVSGANGFIYFRNREDAWKLLKFIKGHKKTLN